MIDAYEVVSRQFEQMAIEYGLVIRRRYPGECGYEYRLSLPAEPEDGNHWHYCLDERTPHWLNATNVMRLTIAYIAEQLLAKRLAA